MKLRMLQHSQQSMVFTQIHGIQGLSSFTFPDKEHSPKPVLKNKHNKNKPCSRTHQQ